MAQLPPRIDRRTLVTQIKQSQSSRRWGLAAHGLRKAACRRLAEAGCTPHQIKAISGHKTLAEVTRYTDAADQKRLAMAAMEAMQQRFRDGK
jgi:integrase